MKYLKKFENVPSVSTLSDDDRVRFKKLSYSGGTDDVMDFLNKHKQDISNGLMKDFICYLAEKGRKDILDILHSEGSLSDPNIKRSISWLEYQLGTRFDTGQHQQMIDYLKSI